MDDDKNKSSFKGKSMFSKDEESMPKDFENKKRSKKLALGKIFFSLILVFVLAFFINQIFFNKGGIVTTMTESSLQKVLEISDLSTLEYTYNAITTVFDEEKRTEKYHVAYEGNVVAGINFSDIDIEVDEDKKEITIKIPDVEIQSTSVNMGELDFMFMKDKYETETVSKEAYKASIEDLQNKAEKEESLLSMAKENAISTVEALVKPWVEQMDNKYIVIIK